MQLVRGMRFFVASTQLHQGMGFAADESAHRVHAMLQRRFDRLSHHLECTVEIGIGARHILALHGKKQLFAVEECTSKALVAGVGMCQNRGAVLIVELREELLCLLRRIARRSGTRSFCGRERRDEPDAQHSRIFQQHLLYLVGNRAVHFEHVVGKAALAFPQDRRVADIDAGISQCRCHKSENARHILLVDDSGAILPRYLDLYPIDPGQPSRTATYRFAAYAQHFARSITYPDIDRIGMAGLRLGVDLEIERDALCPCNLERIADAQVVRSEAQKACNESTVGTVAAIGMGKRAIEGEAHLLRRPPHQFMCHERDAQRSCRVG